MMGSNADFGITPAKIQRVGPEANPWWWNPNNVSAIFAPQWFRTQLAYVGEELEVTWNPILERWAVFIRAPKVQHPICRGWKLLFIHQTGDKGYLPLDERMFARLYAASAMEHGNAKQYLARVVSEIERDRELQLKRDQQDQIDMSMPFFDHSQISVAMHGKSNGSKFSTYHS